MTLLTEAAAGTTAAPVSSDLVVVGAHLEGQPLNGELLSVGATLVGAVETAPRYRLFALDTSPAKPGLLRVAVGGGSIAAERWRLPTAAFGAFVATLSPPMSIGPVQLSGGDWVPGFLVEAAATQGAFDITHFGGWRAFLSR